MNPSYIKSFAGGGAKTLATPIDSLATGFDLGAYRRRRRRMAAVPGTRPRTAQTLKADA